MRPKDLEGISPDNDIGDVGSLIFAPYLEEHRRFLIVAMQ